jgi:hypothetical protein
LKAAQVMLLLSPIRFKRGWPVAVVDLVHTATPPSLVITTEKIKFQWLNPFSSLTQENMEAII